MDGGASLSKTSDALEGAPLVTTAMLRHALHRGTRRNEKMQEILDHALLVILAIRSETQQTTHQAFEIHDSAADQHRARVSSLRRLGHNPSHTAVATVVGQVLYDSNLYRSQVLSLMAERMEESVSRLEEIAGEINDFNDKNN